MVTLINEIHFWTLKDDVILKESDISCFKVYTKGATVPLPERRYLEEKQSYAEGRGLTWIPKNSRPHKLRDTMKELEEVLCNQRCVTIKWNNPYPLQIFFNNGILASIVIKNDVFEVESISIDRFLVGKLISEHVVDVILEDTFMLVSYVEGKLSYIYFGKNSNMFNPDKPHVVSKFANLDLKIITLDMVGSPSRRLERKLSLNLLKDLVLVWWSDSAEVRPWMPLTLERDRATAMVYSLGHQSCEMMCYGRIEHDPLSAIFSRYQPNHVLAVEEKVSNSDISASISVYEASRGRFFRISETLIPLQGHIITLQWNEMEDKLLMACDDCSLVMYDAFRQVTQQTMAQIPPVEIAWHPSGTIAFLSSEVGQIQCFDSALSNVELQLLTEECNCLKVLELTPYFKQQPNLWRVLWKNNGGTPLSSLSCDSAKSMLCLLFERGPLVFLSFSLGIQSPGSNFGQVELITQYLKRGKIDEAVCLLLSIDWSRNAETCYRGLSKIVNFLLRKPLDIDREAQLEAALGSFYAPAATIPEIVLTKYSEHVRHLARRFFFHLLRYHRFEKAFLLAVDLECQDLFMNLHYAALQKGEMKLAAVSLQHVERLERGSEATTTEDESVEDEEDFTEFTEEEEESEEESPNDYPVQNTSQNFQFHQILGHTTTTDVRSVAVHQAVVQPTALHVRPLFPDRALNIGGTAKSYKWPITQPQKEQVIKTNAQISGNKHVPLSSSPSSTSNHNQITSSMPFLPRESNPPRLPSTLIPSKAPAKDVHITIESSEPETEVRRDSPPPPLPPRMPRRPPQSLRAPDSSLISWDQNPEEPNRFSKSNINVPNADIPDRENNASEDTNDPTDEDVESARVKFIHFGVV